MRNQEAAQRRMAARDLRVGAVQCRDFGQGFVKLECAEPESDGEGVACLIPVQVIQAIRALSAQDRQRLFAAMGVLEGAEAVSGYVPQFFSARLKHACRIPGKRSGVAHAVAKALRVSDMCVSHWIAAHSHPSAEQALQIAGLFGWDPDETLADLRHELGWRKLEMRKRATPRRLPSKPRVG